jgi:hypothetical protein
MKPGLVKGYPIVNSFSFLIRGGDLKGWFMKGHVSLDQSKAQSF